jgi:hypothetical protein
VQRAAVEGAAGDYWSRRIRGESGRGHAGERAELEMDIAGVGAEGIRGIGEGAGGGQEGGFFVVGSHAGLDWEDGMSKLRF